MSRVTLWDCASPLTVEVLRVTLSVIGDRPCTRCIGEWTDLERRIVYDWARREHLAASDHPVRRRPRPYVTVVCAHPVEPQA
jgi:hypothetical protein